MKTAIIYASGHHHNTEKVVRAMADGREVDLFTPAEAKDADLSAYDCVGLASGIYFCRFRKDLVAWACETDALRGKAVFFVYTCGFRHKDFSKRLRKALCKKDCRNLGVFWCRGYDTFGILKAVGGIAKRHPDARDLKRAQDFMDGIAEQIKQ